MATGPLVVVDDDVAIVALVTEILADEGYRVTSATTAPEARRLLEAYGPEGCGLVISDSFTATAPSAGMFGWLDQLRALTRAPVVICSVHPAATLRAGWSGALMRCSPSRLIWRT